MLVRYLADLGVDDTLASFIAMYSDYKEQHEYALWMTDVEKHLLKK